MSTTRQDGAVGLIRPQAPVCPLVLFTYYLGTLPSFRQLQAQDQLL